MKELLYRHAKADDVDEMYSLLKEHGPNKWNYLPEGGVIAELRDVADGKAVSILAELGDYIVGFAIAYPGFIRFPEYTTPSNSTEIIGYIGDIVVHMEHSGKGIGTVLVEEVKAALIEHGISEIYIDCHEENTASRLMMKKAGFEEVAVYFDPERRFVGSRRSWVGRFISLLVV